MVNLGTEVVQAKEYMDTKTVTLLMAAMMAGVKNDVDAIIDSSVKSAGQAPSVPSCFGDVSIANYRYALNTDLDRCSSAPDKYGNAGILRLCKKHIAPEAIRNSGDDYMAKNGIAQNYPYKTLTSLYRCRIKYSKDTDLVKSSFSMPLWYVRHWMEMCIPTLRPIFSRLLGIIDTLWAVGDRRYIDDCCRQIFSKMDTWLFTHSVEFDPIGNVLNSLIGFANLGGPRAWRPSEIQEKLRGWVSKPVAPYQTDDARGFEESKMCEWMNAWVLAGKIAASAEDRLTFEEFCTDPNKWATSGGAPAVDIVMNAGVSKVRSKWAWALTTLAKTSNVYHEARKVKNIARVALKEEAKTRLVITTPMDSYLRQSYILYILGKTDFLKSTITNGSIMDEPMKLRWPHCVCIDASKFDHCVTKEFMISFWTRLSDLTRGQAGVVGSLSELCDHEVKHLETLSVEYDGTMIKYNNGLLSGWRVTSLVGSIKSALLCEYIIKKTGISPSVDYMVQGDDIIMLSHSPMDKATVLKCCEQMGVEVNSKKTTFSPCGEFLKYRYRPDVVTGLPVRAVRSMYYANPWLDQSINRQPSEVMNTWHMFASRVVCSWGCTFPWTEFYTDAVKDTRGWMGYQVSSKDMWALLKTPTSLGGLGTIEMMPSLEENITTVSVVKEKFDSDLDKALGLFGISSGSTVVKQYVVSKIENKTRKKIQQFIFGSMSVNERPDKVRPGRNMFKTIVETMFECGFTTEWFQQIHGNLLGPVEEKTKNRKFYPRYLRKTSRWYEVVSYLMAPDKVSLPPSLFLNTRYDSTLGKEFNKICSWVTFTQRSMSAGKTFMLGMYGIDYFLRTRTFVHSL